MESEMILSILTDDQKARIRDKVATKIEKEIDNIKASDLIDVEAIADGIREDLYDHGSHDIAELINKWIKRTVKRELGVK